VFDRFRQGDSSTTRAHGGLGLGLAIVRHLVELHGGAARAESAGEGRGAMFTVTLPIRAPAPGSDAPPWRGAEPTTTEAVLPPHEALANVRVLVVDDEADTRELLAVTVSEAGAVALTAASTPEALEALPGFRPDVVVSDVGMPGEDGYALIRRIRALDPAQGADVPAIALTAYVRPEDARRAFLAGFQLHLGKPIVPADLVGAIARLVSRGGRSG
jgi:CheY-like chemotaxis protein